MIKKWTLSFLIMLLSLGLFTQVPTGISYQTIIRNNDGQAIVNKELSLRITIRIDESDGEAVYSEIHQTVSNGSGLVNLVIGHGQPIFGDFEAIIWGKNNFYFETSVDINADGNFLMLGTTQFLSVPYSLFSEASAGLLCLTEQERNSLPDPKPGMQIFNTTTNCLNFYNGSIWFETCGSQVKNLPPETPSNPSPPDNATHQPLQLTLPWQCNDPENDPLTFDIYFGSTNPPQLFQNGAGNCSFNVSNLLPASTYYWKIVAHDSQGNTTNGPVWSFQTDIFTDPEVNAGPDQTICEGFPAELAAVASNYTNIQWFTEGFGIFTDENSLMTTYHPSFIDYLIGYTKLILVASPIPPSTNYGEDSLFIYYVDPPTTPNAGPDQMNLSGTGTTLQANTPEMGTGIWSIVSGDGGTIDNPANPASLFFGMQGEAYVLRWSIISTYCTLNDDVTVSFKDWSCGMIFTDFRDNREYGTVQIGPQCWMSQNLNTGTRINSPNDQTDNGAIEKHCYEDLETNCSIYGGLYQWNEMMVYTNIAPNQGICPVGWHIPSHNEFIELVHTLGEVTNAGGKMKSTGTIESGNGRWHSPNTGASNSSGFTGYPGGFLDTTKEFYYMGYFAYFWTSSENGSTSAWYRGLYNYGEEAHAYSYNKNYGFSVRCVKD